ncbi:hypothetical protein PG993_002004 [Apiospora rasikravindrae]|uniref:Uncharacterized protein n=1 Tax=Apiospora rasikravindrae TaxID=990691 RepID=A0ABR1UCZ9_9PEZI
MQDQALSGSLSKHLQSTTCKKGQENMEEGSDAPAWNPLVVAGYKCPAEAPPNDAPAIGKDTASYPTPDLPPAYENVHCRPVGASCEGGPRARRPPHLDRAYDIVIELVNQEVLDELTEMLGKYTKLDPLGSGLYYHIIYLCFLACHCVVDDRRPKVVMDAPEPRRWPSQKYILYLWNTMYSIKKLGKYHIEHFDDVKTRPHAQPNKAQKRKAEDLISPDTDADFMEPDGEPA